MYRVNKLSHLNLSLETMHRSKERFLRLHLSTEMQKMLIKDPLHKMELFVYITSKINFYNANKK